MLTDIFSRLDNICFSLEVPVIAFDFIAILHFIVIVTMIIVLEAAVFFVIAFGCIAAAIVVLLGPVFIPFFIVPKYGMAVLGMVQSVPSVFLLPSRRQRLSVCLRQHARPPGGLASAALRRGDHCPIVCAAAIPVNRVYLWRGEDPVARQFAVQRQF